MEIKGEANGILVVEDFAHHPTAIRLTLEAARTRWPGRKIWAAVEPRSNTMRRKIFEDVLPESLALADAVLIGPVNRAQLLDEDERLSPGIHRPLARSIAAAPQKPSTRPPKSSNYLAAEAKPGDLVMVMSNGSFDGLSGKLLERFKSLEGVREMKSAQRIVLGTHLIVFRATRSRYHQLSHLAEASGAASLSRQNADSRRSCGSGNRRRASGLERVVSGARFFLSRPRCASEHCREPRSRSLPIRMLDKQTWKISSLRRRQALNPLPKPPRSTTASNGTIPARSIRN